MVTKVLEYNSCYHHGHLKCYKPNQPLAGGKTAQQLFNDTLIRQKIIEQKYPVEVIWHCDAQNLINSKPEYRQFYKNVKVPPRIRLRDSALKGGRVECFGLFYKCKEGEEIQYYDIVSLYPWVQKTGTFPLGDPIVITRENITGLPWTTPEGCRYKGFILCDILPPKNLKLPLLGYKSASGSFSFTLCAKCSDEERAVCMHGDDDRAWTATFTHLELKRALQLGYTVKKVYEVGLLKK